MQKFLKKLLIFPVLAIFSRKFYIPVICYFRGFGQGHLLRSSGLAAVLMTVGILMHFHGIFQEDVFPVASRVPAFGYADGMISLQGDAGQDYWQRDEDSRPYALYHYENGGKSLGIYPEKVFLQTEELPVFDFEGANGFRPVINIYADSFCFGLSGMENTVCMSHKILLADGQNTVTATEMIDNFLSRMTMVYTGLFIIVLYFFIIIRQSLMIIVTTMLSLLVEIIVKISLPHDSLLRLNTYANTLPLAMLVVSTFFLDNQQVVHAMSNGMTILLPLIYVYMALSDFRSNLIVSVKENLKSNGENGEVNHISVNEMNGNSPFDGSDGHGPKESSAGSQTKPDSGVSAVRDAEDGNDGGVFTP